MKKYLIFTSLIFAIFSSTHFANAATFTQYLVNNNGTNCLRAYNDGGSAPAGYCGGSYNGGSNVPLGTWYVQVTTVAASNITEVDDYGHDYLVGVVDTNWLKVDFTNSPQNQGYVCFFDHTDIPAGAGCANINGASVGDSATGTIVWSSSPSYTLPNPTISFLFPAQSATVADFSHFELNIANVTTTDEYKLTVYYSPFGSSITYTDYNSFYPSVSTTSVTPINKSIVLASLTTSTAWSAYAYLDDLTEGGILVATSTAITFDVNPATSTYTEIYASSTLPPPYSPGILASTSTAFATSTCGWGDVGCAIGNIFDNVMNYIFGIDPTEIKLIAGFNMATQAPFNEFAIIQNDFASVSASTAIAASSSIQMNLGNGDVNVSIFNPTMARNMFGAAAPIVRNLILASLIILMIFGFYQEIKTIFNPHA